MSPRELSDVRDDVCSALPANVFTRHSGFDPESRPGVIAYKPPPDPKPTSFRAWPGIQSLSLHRSRIKVTSRARRRPGWRGIRAWRRARHEHRRQLWTIFL